MGGPCDLTAQADDRDCLPRRNTYSPTNVNLGQTAMATISQSLRDYEAWLHGQLGADLVEADIAKKHAKMGTNAFVFLRATYWRWAETIFDICPGFAMAPQVLAIGDTHLENFGTWRDAEGRLVWGANDFDDAAVMPYSLDLIRLTASALLARSEDGPPAHVIAESILAGYRRAMQAPVPIILERDHKWLRKALLLPDAERRAFWDRFAALRPGSKPVPPAYAAALGKALPADCSAYVPKPRAAGTGSLGRPRFVAYAEWQGGPVLREAKAMLRSAWSLAHSLQDDSSGNHTIHAVDIAAGRMRCPDPHYRLLGTILVRRLSPNSIKIEIDRNAEMLLSPDMLDLMGFEIGNCHSNDPASATAIELDLRPRTGTWLSDAAKAAAAAVAFEQKAWSQAT
jgi:hypothetical protein